MQVLGIEPKNGSVHCLYFITFHAKPQDYLDKLKREDIRFDALWARIEKVAKPTSNI